MDLRKSPWAAGGLLVVGLLFLLHGALARPHPLTTRPSSRSTIPMPAVPAPARSPSRFADWGVSPFLVERGSSPSGTAAMPSARILSGILWDPQSPSAIVDNHLVHVGDHVGGWRVQEIRQDRVILSDGTATEVLALSSATGT